MTDQAATEWRVKQNNLLLVALAGLICSISGMVVGFMAVLLFGIGKTGAGTFAVVTSIVFGLYGVLLLSRLYSKTDAGYNRTFWEWVGDKYEDPPLEQWKETLEEQNAFAVTEGDKK